MQSPASKGHMKKWNKNKHALKLVQHIDENCITLTKCRISIWGLFVQKYINNCSTKVHTYRRYFSELFKSKLHSVNFLMNFLTCKLRCFGITQKSVTVLCVNIDSTTRIIFIHGMKTQTSCFTQLFITYGSSFTFN